MTALAFDLTAELPAGRTVIEASAGTGKTYSLTGLIVRYIAERDVPVDQFLVVTFTRAAANDLRDRTRSTLRTASDAFASGVAPDTYPWMALLIDPGLGDAELAARQQRVDEAINRFDELSVTTIHGFCQQALGQLGVRAGIDPSAVLIDNTAELVAEVCRDLIVAELADEPRRLNSPPTSTIRVRQPSNAETHLINNVTTLINNPGAAYAPRLPHPRPNKHQRDIDNDSMAERWLHLTQRALHEVSSRQRQRGEIGYDSLISSLRDALLDPAGGAAVAEQLAQRSSVVLVDEFQDTDRLQWDVFQTAFASRTLITVGDPKQAIYRFRGADVHAYLDAVDAGAGFTLGTNYRSDRSLLDGLGYLFDGATLGDPRISFHPVDPQPGALDNALSVAGDSSSAAVRLRVVPLDDTLRSAKRRGLSMPLIRTLVLGDLVTRTVDILDHGTITEANGVERSVDPGDIAVLVPSHAEANNVAEALRRACVPAVRTRTGSVTVTPAASQWRLLLAAMAEPHRAPLVRAAALGWFLPTDVASLVESDDVLLALQEHVAAMADRLRQIGLSAFYDEQKSIRPDRIWGVGVLPTVLGREGGERHLTDLDHLAELLASAVHGDNTDPTQVLRTLDELIASSNALDEDAMRRIDSDARAVQITTIHSAKGLEYPIVLVPFAFKQRSNLRLPHSYIAPDGLRTLDIASTVGWDGGLAAPLDGSAPPDESTRYNQVARREWAGLDIEGDELRLLYVALTRAQHRLEVWWASTQDANGSALGRILLDRNGAGPVQNIALRFAAKPPTKTGKTSKGFDIVRPPHRHLPEADVIAQLHQLADESTGTIELIELPVDIEPPIWSGRRDSQPRELRTATHGSRTRIAEPAWRRWSFSGLGSQLESDLQRRDLALDDTGGYDEPSEQVDEVALLVNPESSAEPTAPDQLSLFTATLPSAPVVAPLADIAGGTRFGTFVHSVLEDLNFASADLHDEVDRLVDHHTRRAGIELPDVRPSADVVTGLVAALHTPLGPLFSGRSLVDFGPGDRLAELTFDIPLLRGLSGRSITAGAIGQILLATLTRDDPMRPFATQLADDMADLDIAGWMHGSIDAVFRVPDPHVAHGHRYVVVDYKTNRLHTPGDADPVGSYRPELLIEAMEHSRYPLQALLYTVAVHRYLRWRLGPSYSPDHHLGGAGYLFVRGMVGPNTPTERGIAHGVCSWRPATAAVLAIDQFFADGSMP
ncbi:MAG: UvrD-helicase domain-containing protein [Ilumatobacteraceae bacterium]